MPALSTRTSPGVTYSWVEFQLFVFVHICEAYWSKNKASQKRFLENRIRFHEKQGVRKFDMS